MSLVKIQGRVYISYVPFSGNIRVNHSCKVKFGNKWAANRLFLTRLSLRRINKTPPFEGKIKKGGNEQ